MKTAVLKGLLVLMFCLGSAAIPRAPWPMTGH